jgi:Cysteine-rich secretory protein family
MDLCILYRIRLAVKRPQLVLFLLLIASPWTWSQTPRATVDQPLSWLNGIRRAADAAPLAEDLLLSRTAAQWAVLLARAGVLSHHGSDGSTALDRYRSLGGTEVRVGEILGAGPRLADVENGWLQSNEHRSLAVARQWTHAGWGSDNARGKQVWVVLFCQKLVEDLVVSATKNGTSVSGRFGALQAARAVLIAGVTEVPPVSWDPDSRRFVFMISDPSLSGSQRLGYRSEDGSFRLTNVLTSPPEKEFPGDSSRFSPPAPSP